MPRTKEFEKDGAKFTITPLTLAQVEAWQKAEPRNLSDNTLTAIYTPQFRDVVCPSLNNALNGAPESERWTPEKCFETFDQVLAMELFSAILEFSGYQIARNGVKPEGEDQALSTSQTSVG